MYVQNNYWLVALEAQKKRPLGENLESRLRNLANGRDEMNLCEVPFATLSERHDGRNMLRFEVETMDRDLNRMVVRTLTVKGDPEFGLPTEKDEEIYLGLLKYTSDYNGFASPEVRLSRPALFDLMGWPKSDWAYSRLMLGMQRLVGVRLSYEHMWRDNRKKQWRDQGAFGILESFNFRDSRSAGGGAFIEHSSVFRWSNVLFESFDSGYLKRIDYGLARNLSATARRLYRYLDKYFNPPHRTTITIDLARLAYQHIGVSTGVELDKVHKRHIGPAAEELEAAGFLVAAAADDRFQRVCRGVWNATFRMAEAPKLAARENHAPVESLVAALEQRGLEPIKARQFATGSPHDTLIQAIKAFDEQRASGAVIRSPARWLTKAVQNGFRPSVDIDSRVLRPERRIFRRDATDTSG